ncbi:MAG: tRNA (guanosine(37)-N1)-methyltransferase TrmD [Dehalococcoidia bacterium]
MKISIITLFPEMFEGPFQHSIVGRAQTSNLVEIELVQLREFSTDKRGRVDDTPYGGGPGMVLQAPPLAAAVDSVAENSEAESKPHVVLMSAQGEKVTHRTLELLSSHESVVIVCGHYEGVDQRFIETRVDEELSIGDFVMTGGEIPAMALTDGMVRLIPGVLGDDQSAVTDSHSPELGGLLEGPVYTRPLDFEGLPVPDVLLKGDHAKIESWRKTQSIKKTEQLRPDLLDGWPEQR